MDTTPGSDNRQENHRQEANSEILRFSPELEMTKRKNHYVSDKTGIKKELLLFTRIPRLSLIALRRSWNLKLFLLLALCAITAMCMYSGMLTFLVPSVTFNLLLGENDRIRAPRIAIELGPSDLKSEDFHRFVLTPHRAETQEISTTQQVQEARKGPRGQRRYPSAIIFGVSKCGTRAVLEYLKLHPDVVAPMSEINFFNNNTLFNRGANWYLQQMPLARSYQMVVEKSPDYFQEPECAPMIHRLNSSMRLLLLLRDPVERLVSQYMQFLDKNPKLPRFEEWVIHPLTKRVNTNIRSVMVSAYSKYLEVWLSVFPRDQIMIIESDNLRESPHAEMQRVERFLNLKPYFQPNDFYFNSTRGFYCLRNRSNGKTKCLGKSKGRQHIPVNENVLRMLYSFYQPYNDRLNELLGIKFPWS